MSRAMLLCVLLCTLHVCVGSRVLVVFPVPSRSHTILGDSIVKTLLQTGHEVTYVSPSSSLQPSELLTRVNISSVTESATDKERFSLLELIRNPRPPQKVLEVGTTFARRALEHNATLHFLADTAQTFDVVIAEWFFTGLLAPLASVYNCPLIWYSAMDASWVSLQVMHGHTNPAYSANPQARSAAAEFSVGERVTRLWKQVHLTGWVYYMTYYVELSMYHDVYGVPFGLRGRPLPDYEALVYNGSMLLVNSHPLLGQTLTMPQNTKYVGGHHIEETIKPLQKNLQQLLDRSTNGVIFFSLGSNIKSKDLPERTQKKLLELFGHLEQTVIWKFEENLVGLPRNVHILKWAPQISILRIPLFGDQFLTMELASARGRAIRVDFTQDLPYRIYDAVHKILGNGSYRSNSQKASAIFRQTLVPPAQELLHWIELVIHHGADHLRSPAVQLSIIQKLHLDLVALK